MAPNVSKLYHFVRTPTYVQPYLEPLELSTQMREDWKRKGSEDSGKGWREHVRNIWMDREKYWVMVSRRENAANGSDDAT